MVNFLLNFRYMVHTLAPYTFLPADLISVSATRLVISASRLGASIYDVCAQGGLWEQWKSKKVPIESLSGTVTGPGMG